MTVTTTLNQQTFPCNGLTTQFGFAAKIFAASDLTVTLIDGLGNLYPFVNQANAATGLSYIVQNVDVDTGCTIVMSGAPTNGWTLDVRSNVPETQPSSIKNQGQFLPELHEEALDRATRLVQDVRRLCYTFGIHGPDLESVPWTALPSKLLRANTWLGFDSNGLPIVGNPASTATFGSQVVNLFNTVLGQTVFNLTAVPASVNNLLVSLDGSLLFPGDDYSLAGATLTLVNGTLGGQRLYVSFGQIVSQNVPSAASVTDAMLAPSSQIYAIDAGFNRSQNEINAAVFPTNPGWNPGDPRRYGAALNGVTDDTAAMQRWGSVGGFLTYPGLPTVINGTITLPSGTVIQGTRGGLIQCNTGGISLFTAIGASDIQIRGLHTKQTAATNTGLIAHFFFNNCTDVIVEGNKCEGINWGGIDFHNGSLRCKARYNVFTGVLLGNGAHYVQDTHDIGIFDGSSFCTVEENDLYGSGDHGCLVQDRYNTPAKSCYKNKVHHNRVSAKGAYGIAVYQPGQSAAGGIPLGPVAPSAGGAGYTNGVYLNVPLTGGLGANATAHITVAGGAVTSVIPVLIGAGYGLGDILSASNANLGGAGAGFTYTIGQPVTPDSTFTEVTDNEVEGILGNSFYNGFSGAGIYWVGVASAGIKVDRNTVLNCSINTTAGRTLPPGAIAGSGNYSGTAPFSVNDNTIAQQTQFEAVDLVTLLCGGTVKGNKILLPAGNVTGSAIRLDGCQNVDCEGNPINHLGTGAGILLYANALNTVNCIVKGNPILTANGPFVQVAVNAVGLQNQNAIVEGNNGTTAGAGFNGYSLSGIATGVFKGNIGSVGNVTPLVAQNCSNVTYESNRLSRSAGQALAQFNGSGTTNAGSFWSKSNGATMNQLINNGFGMLCETIGPGVPGAGSTQAQGDVQWNSAPVNGGTELWVVATAGSPATPRTMANS